MSEQEKNSQEPQVFKLAEGDVRVWIEQEAIHLLAYDRPHYDPVELTSQMARALAAKLEQMAN